MGNAGGKRTSESYHRFASGLMCLSLMVCIVGGILGGVSAITVTLRAIGVYIVLGSTLKLLHRAWASWEDTRQVEGKKAVKKP